MTTILISEVTKINETTVLELTNGNQTAFVTKFSTGIINVIADNQSHAAYRGFGRMFQSWEAAESGYRSAFMKSAISSARAMLNS